MSTLCLINLPRINAAEDRPRHEPKHKNSQRRQATPIPGLLPSLVCCFLFLLFLFPPFFISCLFCSPTGTPLRPLQSAARVPTPDLPPSPPPRLSVLPGQLIRCPDRQSSAAAAKANVRHHQTFPLSSKNGTLKSQNGHGRESLTNNSGAALLPAALGAIIAQPSPGIRPSPGPAPAGRSFRRQIWYPTIAGRPRYPASPAQRPRHRPYRPARQPRTRQAEPFIKALFQKQPSPFLNAKQSVRA